MDTLAKQRMTVEEFLAWAEAQPDGRYELVQGDVVRMSPERVRHVRGKYRIWRIFDDAVVAAGLTNEVLGDGIGVVVPQSKVRDPDVVVCLTGDHDPEALTVDDPLIIVEVVSPTSETTDTVDKLAEYFTIASVHHYLIVRNEDGVVEHHARSATGEIRKTVLTAGDTLRLAPPGFEVPVAALLG